MFHRALSGVFFFVVFSCEKESSDIRVASVALVTDGSALGHTTTPPSLSTQRTKTTLRAFSTSKEPDFLNIAMCKINKFCVRASPRGRWQSSPWTIESLGPHITPLERTAARVATASATVALFGGGHCLCRRPPFARHGNTLRWNICLVMLVCWCRRQGCGTTRMATC